MARSERNDTTLRVLVVRVLLLLGSLGLVVAGGLVAFGGAATPVAAYACPMHREVTSARPSDCPICKMELEPIARDKPASKTAPPRAPGPGVQHGFVCPMHPEITSASPGTCPQCKMDLEPVSAKTPDAPAPAVVPAVSHTPATGVTWLPEMFPPAPKAQPNERFALATLRRKVFSDGVKAPAWLETPDRVAALLYRDEVGALAPGQRAALYRSLSPRVALEVELADDAPRAWDDATSIAIFRLSGEHAGRAGDTGWLEIQSLSRELAVLPETAILRADHGPYVLMAHGRHYVRRPIEIGRTLRGNVVVLSGLAEHDHVVVGGAFFLDVEHRGSTE